ncbi:unnamed protein product [Tilletia controversa]|nr:unnamed protein product [Tilletia controversa]CAD6973537.1 unnamed protein product [Tilletia controversa]
MSGSRADGNAMAVRATSEAPLGSQLRAALDAYEESTLSLFAAIENGSAFESSNSSNNKNDGAEQQQPLHALLSTIHRLDEHLQSSLIHRLLPTHTAQQHTIDALVRLQRARDQDRKTQIERLSRMKADLDLLVRRGREEKIAAEKAETEPLSYKHILNYASYLSRTTSAPPGHRPPGFGLGAAVKDEQLSDQQQQQQMDWPFPSEAQMRRGALAAAAVAVARTDELHRPSEAGPTGEGAAAAAAATGGTAVAAAAGLDVQHAPQNFPLPGQPDHPSQQHHHHHHQQQEQVEMEEDAFDLDLN